jgi:hypothetical protein
MRWEVGTWRAASCWWACWNLAASSSAASFSCCRLTASFCSLDAWGHRTSSGQIGRTTAWQGQCLSIAVSLPTQWLPVRTVLQGVQEACGTQQFPHRQSGQECLLHATASLHQSSRQTGQQLHSCGAAVPNCPSPPNRPVLLYQPTNSMITTTRQHTALHLHGILLSPPAASV